jgi:Tol biopolymer transport system component
MKSWIAGTWGALLGTGILSGDPALAVRARFGMPSAPVVSPDGNLMAWVSRTRDLTGNGRHDRIYLAELKTGVSPPPPARPLTREDADSYDPLFLPGGDAISFLSAHAGKTQVYVLPVSGGGEVAATNSITPVLEHAWTPGGSLLYVCDNKRWGMAIWIHGRSQEVPSRKTRHDTLRPSVRTLWMIAPDGGQPVAVAQADFIQQIAVSHDGRRVVFRSANRTGNIPAFDLYSADLVSQEVTRLTDRIGDEASPQFSFDDRMIYFLAPGEASSAESSTQIYSIPSNAGEIQLVTRHLEESLLEFETCADSDHLLATTDDRFFDITGESDRMLLRIDPGTGEHLKILDVPDIQDLAVHPSGERALFRYYDVSNGNEIGAWTSPAQEILHVTDLNDPFTSIPVDLEK